MDKIREFFGKHTNLLTHLLAGYVIASIVTNLMFLQEGYFGLDILLCAVPGILMALIAGCVKELIDFKADWDDILFTTLGGALNAIFICIGLLFHLLS